MPKVSLSGMTVEALMDLRRRVDEMLDKRRAELQKQLERMDPLVGGRGGQRGSALKGRKVPPKYRSTSGETWAGRGARPRWLVDAIKGGSIYFLQDGRPGYPMDRPGGSISYTRGAKIYLS